MAQVRRARDDPTAAPREALLPWQGVRVSGPSMVPTLRSGDLVIVRHGTPVRPGDVVLARFHALPDLLVVKRAVRAVSGGWYVASDNAAAGGDSAAHGPAEVLGRVVLRLRRGALPRRPAQVR